MPPIPPMPPPGIAGTASFGCSATMASVITSRPRYRSRILECNPNDLRRIDDAGLNEVLLFFGLGIEAVGVGLAVEHPANDL